MQGDDLYCLGIQPLDGGIGIIGRRYSRSLLLIWILSLVLFASLQILFWPPPPSPPTSLSLTHTHISITKSISCVLQLTTFFSFALSLTSLMHIFHKQQKMHLAYYLSYVHYAENFMMGYRLVFDWENLKLGWSHSNCKSTFCAQFDCHEVAFFSHKIKGR